MAPEGLREDPRGLRAKLDEHLEWMAVRNYSPRTISNRRHNVGCFIAWCEERGLGRPTEVTKPILERYQSWLFHFRRESGEPLSFRTQYSRLSPVRSFFKWLTRYNQVLYNPAAELELPKLEKRLPRDVLTAAEVERVLGQPDLDEPLGLRDRAILETLYSTGIRRQELLGLALTDIDRHRGTVMVRHGKGRKDRVVPIGERALAWCDRYVHEARPLLVVGRDEGVLFLSARGGPLRPNRLTAIVGGYVTSAELGKRGACHLFRHTMATLMLEGGADIRYIQQMLGHAELTTTEVYTRVSIGQLKKVHEDAHPARWKRRDDDTDARDEHERAVAALRAALDAEGEDDEDL